MAITSVGYDGQINETQWANLAAFLGSPYAVAGVNDWGVSVLAGSDRSVKINPGSGYGCGVLDTSDAQVTVQLNTISSGTRWDLIVARRTWTGPGGTTTFTKITGTATQGIPAGRLIGPGVQDDQPIALVQVTAGQSAPTAIVDLRLSPSKVIRAGSLLALPNAGLGVEAVVGSKRYRRERDSSGNLAWLQTNRALHYEGTAVDSTGNVSIPDNYTWAPVWTPLTNTLGITTNSRALVIPETGLYLLRTMFQWYGGGYSVTGRVKAMITVNPSSTAMPGAKVTSPAGGIEVRNANYPYSPVAQDVEALASVVLQAGDRVMFSTYQDTGKAQQLYAATSSGRTTATSCAIDYLGAS